MMPGNLSLVRSTMLKIIKIMLVVVQYGVHYLEVKTMRSTHCFISWNTGHIPQMESFTPNNTQRSPKAKSAKDTIQNLDMRPHP